MLLKILSSRPRVESKGTSSFPRKLFQRKATSRKNTMRNFLCRKFTLGSMSIRKPSKGKQSNRIQSNFSTFEARFPSSLRRETILPLKKCYQKFSSSISQIHSRIQLLFQPFRSPPKESNSPSKIFFDKIHRKQLFLFLFLLFRALSKRGSPPNSEGKQFGFAKKCAVIHASRAPRVEGDVCRWPVVLPFPWAPGSLFRGRATASSIHIGPRSVPRWLPYCMSHCRRTPRDGEGREEEEEEDERGGWKEGGWGGR